MALAVGTRLGPYEIHAPLGSGGMGEVYRARDTRLHRDVAIKIVPDRFANDPDRRARFEREAQLLAALNHPNIASIYGFEEANPTGSGQAVACAGVGARRWRDARRSPHARADSARRRPDVVPPDAQNPSDVGLWTGTVDGTRRQIFRGWVAGFAWASSSEVLVLEGKADFQGVLWRVETDGGQQVVLSGVPLFRRHTSANTIVRFDVHPDGRRIVIEALEFFEADIGMIENVR